MKILASLIVCVALSACATSTLNTPHAVLQKAEDGAEVAYQATVDALIAALAANKISTAAEQADWVKAWNDLQAVRKAYNTGQDITALVQILVADETAAKAF